MQRRNGRSRYKRQRNAWELTALLLIALLGVSLVNEPETNAAGKTEVEAAPTPVTYETQSASATEERADAPASGEDEPADARPQGRQP